ncbi:23S rRNA (pseudouridine(1915)-N(3))-methyltransferase RlmH [Ampullimonas aquatilis]|uniref:23S rRNA (pseudouridine(1915)-N(3))-methyltransferase RlmH n=1 Tax=Ampullimonas aquatilis TaxID=1341549 RepID=UPI003C78BB65
MALQIIAVGHKMPGWIETGFQEYAKRMPPELALSLKELKPEVRSAAKPVEKVMALEAERILAALPKQARLIALDEHGEDLTTVALAKKLLGWQREGGDTCFVIGGADGLAPIIKQKAQGLIRLSSMTMPHGMVRVLLAEQLYRAWSINTNHPYHRV